MNIPALWIATLLAMLFGSIFGVFTTGDARWLFLAVLPCWVFSRWFRI